MPPMMATSRVDKTYIHAVGGVAQGCAECPNKTVAIYRDGQAERLRYYRLTALPFGGTGSVYGINRPARLLTAILACLCGVPVCNYFDDYTVVVPARLADTAQGWSA